MRITRRCRTWARDRRNRRDDSRTACQLGLPEGALETTIETFNTGAMEEGPPVPQAPDWLKPLTAPLVALDYTQGAVRFYFTLGGVDTTVEGMVLNEAGGDPGLSATHACGVPPGRWLRLW